MKKTNQKVMKKIILALSLIFLINPGFAYLFAENPGFSFVSLPETSMNVITLHTIESAGYGFGVNSTPTVINLQIPAQNYDDVWFKIGYVPICPLTPNNTEITLYCENEHIFTRNYTDNCLSGVFFDYEWLKFDSSNLTTTIFQTLTPTKVVNCQFYVNNSVDSQVDFWVRIENTGNKIIEETQTVSVIPGLEIFTDGIEAFSSIIVSILGLIVVTLEIFVPLYAIFATPILLIVIAYLFAVRIKEIIEELRK